MSAKFLPSIVKTSVVFVLTLLASRVWSQSTIIGKSCDVGVFGAKDSKSFLAFDRDLRAAIEKLDAGKVALLTQFPLMINDNKGSYYIHDASALQGRFEDVFTPKIRQSILQTKRDSFWCNYTGIAYGGDRVWIEVTDRGYFLMTVNLPSDRKPNQIAGPEIQMACSTSKHRVLVDMAKDGSPRYRSWNVGHSLTEKPDLEIAKGENQSGGTGPCYQSAWSFKNGQTEYTLEGTNGCSGDSDGPPRNAQAKLSIKTPERSEPVSAWCY